MCLLGVIVSSGCVTTTVKKEAGTTFGEDLAFLQEHVEVVTLADKSGNAQVAVIPSLQGRVMTSTAAGEDGLSFGWINRELLASGKTLEHFNPYGGEDRFWIGPEGGQFAVFFKKDDPFDLEHWYTPPAIDTEPFEVVSKSGGKVALKKDMTLLNYSGTEFSLRVDRAVRLLERKAVAKSLGVELPENVSVVAYESVNRITNTGKKPWVKDTGLLSIWILGMFNPSAATTVVIPYNVGPGKKMGAVVNDTYFGKVPADRLVVKEGVMFFSGDGEYRSKIGLLPKRAKDVLGSYDAVNGVLTIVKYNKPARATSYVNSMWKIQKKPYGGDVVNSYNDGPPAPGAKPLGPFYELETSSRAAALKPAKSLKHVHKTFHLQGRPKDLDGVARAVLGVSIAEIKKALGK